MTEPPSPFPPVEPVDDYDVGHCYRHPDRETALACANCDRSICVDCAVNAAVGIKCPECARQPRAALAAVPRTKLIRGVAAGAAAGLVAGFVYDAVRGGFFALIIAYVLGMVIAEVVRRAAGGFRDPQLARAAGASAFGGLALPLLLRVVDVGVANINQQGAIFLLLGAGVAGFAAFTRSS